MPSLQHDGRRRTYLEITPRHPRADAPLLIVLHGSGQTGAAHRRFSGRSFDALAERIGATLLYPDGYRRRWNDARRGLTTAAKRLDIDDVGFVEALVARHGSGRDVHAIGYSNGGQLVTRLLHERPGLLASATIIAAGRPADEDFLTFDTPPQATPTLIIHGTADPVVPYDGGQAILLGRPVGVVLSAPATADYYARRNGAQHASAASPVATSAATTRRDYTVPIGAADAAPVRLITVHDSGHVVPNATTSPLRWLMGPSRHDVIAADEVAEFVGLG